MRKPSVDQALLKEVRFFQEMPDQFIQQLAEIAELREYKTGEFLNQRRRSADYLYVILDGSVNLEQENIAGEKVHLETIFPGAALGFSSLVESEHKKYLSDARTLTPVKALRFSADDLQRLFNQDFELGYLFMRRIALIARRRLVYRTQPLESLSSPQPAV